MTAHRDIPLQYNESYWLLDDETLALARNIPNEYFGVYPSYSGLTSDVARYASVDSRSVVLAPGSDEAIRASVKLCVQKRLRGGIVLPTFSGYEGVLSEIPLDHQRFYYSEADGAFKFPVDDVVSAMNAGAIGALLLCEPNNPLGSPLEPDVYRKLLGAAKEHRVLLVMDEAYIEFGGTSSLSRIGSQPLIVLRTLSKAFGVPGIRVGYAISDTETADALRTILFGTLPWPISGPSVHVARTVLARAEALSERRALLASERAAFIRDIIAIDGMTAFPTTCNFVLARHPSAAAIASVLKKSGIIVAEGAKKTRDRASAALLRNTLRMTVPSPEHRPIVVAALSAAIPSGQHALHLA